MRAVRPRPLFFVALAVVLLASLYLLSALHVFGPRLLPSDLSSSTELTPKVATANVEEGKTVPATISTITATGPLRVLTSNPRYFTDNSGKAIFLAGSHTWSNGMEDRGTVYPPLPFDYDGYMHFMKLHNFNWMRLWTAEMTRVSTSDDPFEDMIGPPFKWVRSLTCCANDGGNKFDFTQLDPNYFSRMRSRIIKAGQNGIYVSVMLFNGYMWEFDESAGDGNPFESGNNVNSVSCGGTCPSDATQISAQAWSYEQAYLRKVVDTVNDLPNVMYEVSNEAGSPYSDDWQASVIRSIKRYEATKAKQHPVGMTFQYQGGSDATLYQSQADWISPPRTKLPPVATGNKVVINDTDHSYFMDPYLVGWPGRNEPGGRNADSHVGTNTDPYWDEIRNALTDIRNYGTKIDLANMTPRGSLSTSGFCLANPGSEYLVFSSSNSFTLTTVEGNYTFEWFNPSTHTIVKTGTVTVGSSQTFTASFTGDSALWLHK